MIQLYTLSGIAIIGQFIEKERVPNSVKGLTKIQGNNTNIG